MKLARNKLILTFIYKCAIVEEGRILMLLNAVASAAYDEVRNGQVES